jgi:hypothetical protein
LEKAWEVRVTGERPLGNAGYVLTGSGGGGNGDFVFASLDELGALIAEWEALRDEIKRDVAGFTQAQYQTNVAPAEDTMSRQQASAVNESMSKAMSHCHAMRAYADSYLAKLTAVREQYRNDDDKAKGRLERIHEV